jgi:acetyltransferase EpsM
MSELWILGTGVLAEEVFALVTDAGLEVKGFVENLEKKKTEMLLCGRPVIWVDDFPNGEPCLCALSTTKRSQFIDQLQGKAQFITFVHPSAVVLPGTTLGEGTLVSSGVLIASHTHIGRHVFINRGARVGHHTHIADYVTLQPGANIAGLVQVGEKSYIGMGAIVIERLQIGKEVTVAAGSVVIENISDHVLVAGNPAQVKKEAIHAR